VCVESLLFSLLALCFAEDEWPNENKQKGKKKHQIEQGINQSINQSINQAINQSRWNIN
jgi:hypothetical protein